MAYKYIKPGAVKSFLKENGMRTGGGFISIFDRSIEKHLLSAIDRAKEDKRKTLKEEDV